MKKTIKTCALLAVTTLFGVSCSGKQDLSGIANLETKIMEDFSKGKTDYFNASHGWSNGSPFAVTWQNDNVAYDDDKMTLEIKKDGEKLTGGELKSKDFFHYGSYSVKMKPMKVDGTASTFFTYTGPSDKAPWDEIDIEFLGKDTTKVQFNYFTDGKGEHEYMYDLGFDASLEYHEYGFRWTEESITWFVDKKPVYQATENIPTHPQRIMMNAWCGDEKGRDWMGKLPSDFTSDKAFYEEIGFQDAQGNAYKPTFEIEPEQNPSDAKWENLNLEFTSTEEYEVTNSNGTHTVKYENLKAETYKNVNAPLPSSALKANAVEFKIKNNGSKTADVRVDVNQLEQVGNTRCINKSAKQDGKVIATNIEWGGSSFTLEPNQESVVEVRYDGPATELMFMLDSFLPSTETKSGEIEIKDIKLGTYKADEPETPENPDDKDSISIDPTFGTDFENYKISKEGTVTTVNYEGVKFQTYKCINAPIDYQGKKSISFKIKNNKDTLSKLKVDVLKGNKSVNLSAKFNGQDIYTDLVNGGSLLDLAPNQEGVIVINFEEIPDGLNIFLDSVYHEDVTTLNSGSVSFSEFILK